MVLRVFISVDLYLHVLRLRDRRNPISGLGIVKRHRICPSKAERLATKYLYVMHQDIKRSMPSRKHQMVGMESIVKAEQFFYPRGE